MDFGIAFPSYVDAWRDCEVAEAVGFTHAWFYDTQLLCSDVYAVMALAAEHTRTMTLGTLVAIPSNRIAPVTAVKVGLLLHRERQQVHRGDDGIVLQRRLLHQRNCGDLPEERALPDERLVAQPGDAVRRRLDDVRIAAARLIDPELELRGGHDGPLDRGQPAGLLGYPEAGGRDQQRAEAHVPTEHLVPLQSDDDRHPIGVRVGRERREVARLEEDRGPSHPERHAATPVQPPESEPVQ